jgi:hypothetical protein
LVICFNPLYMLKYSLAENPLTSDPNDKSAVTYVNHVHTLEDLIDQIVSRGSTVTRAEVLSVFDELCLAVEQSLKAGNAVNTSLFMIMPSIKGRFTGDADSFDRERHEIRLRMKPGRRLKKVVQHIKVEKTSGGKQCPKPEHFYDNATQTRDKAITPGNGARIVGTQLKFSEDAPEQGIFFIHTSNGNITRVNDGLIRNMPSELIFLIPVGMLSGTYRIEVRTVFRHTKVVRSGVLPFTLTVSPFQAR